jgi:hypothetical protein
MHKFKLLLLLILVVNSVTFAQDKRGYAWVYGGGGLYAQFNGTGFRPTVNQLWPNNTGPKAPYYVFMGHSNISDSATGTLHIICNGFIAYNALGEIIENGDTLVPKKLYNSDPVGHNASRTQSSLILPKGSDGQYYIFTTGASDSIFTYYQTMSIANNHKYGVPNDILEYHIVDMNANNGKGKVLEKRKQLMFNERLNIVGMQACKHSNGYDWWLLKQAEQDSTVVFRFLVKADTIIGPEKQIFKLGNLGIWNNVGQSSFSTDGNKYCYSYGKKDKLLIADFDRCTGMLSNMKVVKIPLDSTKDPFDAIPQYFRLDSNVVGTCFSPNDSFIYLTKEYNVYQYEIYNTDSATAWYHVQYGPDTALAGFGYYSQMVRGIDNRIYIGQGSGNFGALSVIDKPNRKGVQCVYCKRCLRDNNGWYSPTAPSNMPDFTLGAKPELCWPTSIENAELKIENAIKAWPNPASTILNVESGQMEMGDVIEVYNNVGAMVMSVPVKNTGKMHTINIERLGDGLYLVKSKYGVVKFLKE